MTNDTAGQPRPLHRLAKVDRDARTAICSECGPVSVRLRKGTKGAECGTKRAQDRARAKRSNPGDRAAQKAYAKRHKEKHGLRLRVERYGLSVAQYQAMIAAQEGLCAICREDIPVAIDHDHSCCDRAKSSCGSCVRGVLCRKCNLGLSFFLDRPDILRAAAKYVS